MNHVGTLLGRIFLIASPVDLAQWNGCIENVSSKSDYDLLEDHISYEEGDLSNFVKSDNVYYIFFSMASKIEIFKNENGFILCDGLYFNKSWDYSSPLDFKSIDELDFKIKITDSSIFIFDAAYESRKISQNKTEGSHGIGKNNFNSYAYLRLVNGLYSVKRVETGVVFDNQKTTLKGIEISQ